MRLCCTRGGAPVSASRAILSGIAPNGGLYVPASFSRFTPEEIGAMTALSYPERAVLVLSRLLDDYTQSEIEDAVFQSYAAPRFDHAAIAPLKEIEPGLWSLELFHGPTLAFKDMALQLLPRLMALAARKCGEARDILILAATSGDTGKAALEGFADVPGTRCAVFYPKDGVSRAQYLQMVTQGGANTHVIAVEGNFDDAQTGVKKLFTDPAYGKAMESRGCVLSSANSINFGRLAPQVAYYFSAYADLLANKAISLGQAVDFVVPTGNFGNILAAHYSRLMGLPVGQLVCASNVNHVLADFVQTGRYDAKRPFHVTASPSMDILISSNLERYLYELSLRSAQQVRSWMDALKTEGVYQIDQSALERLRSQMLGGWAEDAACLDGIAELFARRGTVLDPHTAVGYAVHRSLPASGRPTVLVATASPYKFGATVAQALGLSKGAADDFDCAQRVADRAGERLPQAIASLPTLPIRHRAACLPEQMGDALLRALS